MSEQQLEQQVEIINVVVEIPKEKKPLTHKLSAAQLEDIRRNMSIAPPAQIPSKLGDKNSEGMPRRHPQPQPQKSSLNNEGTIMKHEAAHTSVNIPVVPQNNVQQEPAPAPVGMVAGAAHVVAAVPYGRAAAKGAVFGATAAAAGSLVFFGGRWAIGKIKGAPPAV